MAEIKSAIELAMEKTRGLVMDDKEKSSLALKELAGSVKAIFRRYREGLTDDGEAGEQLEALQCDNALKRKMVLDLLDDEFDVSGEIPVAPALFSFTGFVVDEKSYKELKGITKDYLKELEKLKTVVRSRITEELASTGISGNSVEPNVEAWPKWHEATGDVRRAFREQVLEWKGKLP